MNKHTAQLPDGRTVTRNSKTRTYSHVIAWGHTVAREIAQLGYRIETETGNAKWYAEQGNTEKAEAAQVVIDRVQARLAELADANPAEVLEWMVDGWTGTPELAAKKVSSITGGRFHLQARAIPATLTH